MAGLKVSSKVDPTVASLAELSVRKKADNLVILTVDCLEQQRVSLMAEKKVARRVKQSGSLMAE